MTKDQTGDPLLCSPLPPLLWRPDRSIGLFTAPLWSDWERFKMRQIHAATPRETISVSLTTYCDSTFDITITRSNHVTHDCFIDVCAFYVSITATFPKFNFKCVVCLWRKTKNVHLDSKKQRWLSDCCFSSMRGLEEAPQLCLKQSQPHSHNYRQRKTEASLKSETAGKCRVF